MILDDVQSKTRMNICQSCEKFIKLTQVCNKCFCYMPAKTRLAYSFCPEKKWIAITDTEK